MIAAYGLGLFIAMALGRRYYPLPIPVRAFAEVSIACALMAAVVMALPLAEDMLDVVKLMIKAAIGASVYVFVAFAINAAGCRQIILDIVKKIRAMKSSDVAEVAE